MIDVVKRKKVERVVVPPLTPLVQMQPPKKIGAMSDDERRAFADRIFDALAKTRRPTTST